MEMTNVEERMTSGDSLRKLESLMASKLELCWSSDEKESTAMGYLEEESDHDSFSTSADEGDDDAQDQETLTENTQRAPVVVDFAALSQNSLSDSQKTFWRERKAFLVSPFVMMTKGLEELFLMQQQQSNAVSTSSKADDQLCLSVQGKKKKKSSQREDDDFDRKEDEQDRVVEELFKSSKLIASLRDAQLQGRDRIRYQQEKLSRLSGRHGPSPQKAPLKVRLGMARKAALRTEKAIEEAKSTGMFHSQLKRDLLQKKKHLESRRMSSKKKRTNDVGRGLYGSIGTLKDGIMTVSERQIQSVRRGTTRSRKKTS